jgi:hypothetical protein
MWEIYRTGVEFIGSTKTCPKEGKECGLLHCCNDGKRYATAIGVTILIAPAHLITNRCFVDMLLLTSGLGQVKVWWVPL